MYPPVFLSLAFRRLLFLRLSISAVPSSGSLDSSSAPHVQITDQCCEFNSIWQFDRETNSTLPAHFGSGRGFEGRSGAARWMSERRMREGRVEEANSKLNDEKKVLIMIMRIVDDGTEDGQAHAIWRVRGTLTEWNEEETPDMYILATSGRATNAAAAVLVASSPAAPAAVADERKEESKEQNSNAKVSAPTSATAAATGSGSVSHKRKSADVMEVLDDADAPTDAATAVSVAKKAKADAQAPSSLLSAIALSSPATQWSTVAQQRKMPSSSSDHELNLNAARVQYCCSNSLLCTFRTHTNQSIDRALIFKCCDHDFFLHFE